MARAGLVTSPLVLSPFSSPINAKKRRSDVCPSAPADGRAVAVQMKIRALDVRKTEDDEGTSVRMVMSWERPTPRLVPRTVIAASAA
jgi:hypothetical protein